MIKLLFNVLLGILGTSLVYKGYRRKRLIANILADSSPIAIIPFDQVTKIKGKASCNDPLQDPRTGDPCVFFAYDLLRRVPTKHETAHESYRRIFRESSRVPFVVTDASGAVSVDPGNGLVRTPNTGRYIDLSDISIAINNERIKATLMSLASSVNQERCRLDIHTIPVGCEVYVIGIAQQSNDPAYRIQIINPLLISTIPEENESRRQGCIAWIFLITGLFILAAMAAGLRHLG